MLCKFLKWFQSKFDKIITKFLFPFSILESDKRINKIINDIEENRKEIELYIKNFDPLTTHYCSIRHAVCASEESLLVWAKDSNHRYITANEVHLRVFYSKTLHQLEEIIGNTAAELVEEYRESGKEHTFGELCLSTDEIVERELKPMRFFELGYKDGRPLLLDVWKKPLINHDAEFRGSIGRAINMSDREADVYELLHHYIRHNMAIRLDTAGLNSDSAIYEIITPQKSFNRMFPTK